MFEIDAARYKVIDISYTVVPGDDEERPFVIRKARLADDTLRHDITKTHSHVGTHVEVASHFYEKGKTVTDYSLETFHGPAVLVAVRDMRITAETCEKGVSSEVREGDIVVFRNDAGATGSSGPAFTPEAAEWLAARKVKMVVIDDLKLGEDIDATRRFHDILMSKDVVFVEWARNLQAITKPRFFVMALPYKVQGLDSSFCRAIVIEEK